MDHFSQDFILRLVARRFESLRVDYKRALDLSDSKHKQELVKDVSAQANTLDIDETLVAMGMSGLIGCIIIGADEDGNLYDISPLRLDDAKLQQIVNEHITPRIKFRFQLLSEKGPAHAKQQNLTWNKCMPIDWAFHLVRWTSDL
jgi:hypothetical protein